MEQIRRKVEVDESKTQVRNLEIVEILNNKKKNKKKKNKEKKKKSEQRKPF